MARSFPPKKEMSQEERAAKRVDRLLELIDTDYSTLERECRVSHPQKRATLRRLIEQLEELDWCYEVVEN